MGISHRHLPKHRVIRNHAAAQVCSLANIQVTRQKVVTLTQLRSALQISLRQLEQERQHRNLVDKLYLAARLTKATCDAFLGIAVDMSEMLMPREGLGNKASPEAMVNAAYGAASAFADAGGRYFSGQKVDFAKTTGAALKSASSVMPMGKEMPKSAVDFLRDSSGIHADLFVSVVNGDKHGVVNNSIDYAVAVAKLNLSALGRDKYAAFLGIAKKAFDYNDQIKEALDEALDNQVESAQAYQGSKFMIIRLARNLDRTIADMQAFVASCESRLGQLR
jgi:hypothetical protein